LSHIICGVDEAGYGPRLGPLVSCSVSVTSSSDDLTAANLWEAVSGCVVKPGRAKGKMLTVGDSKRVFNRKSGLTRLELSVLSFARAAGLPTENLLTFSEALLAAEDIEDVKDVPWYEYLDITIPLEVSSVRLEEMTTLLDVELKKAGIEKVKVRARILSARQFNRQVAFTDNKAVVLMGLVGDLLAKAKGDAGENNLSVIVDRLGGRTDYAGFLSSLFPERKVQQYSSRKDCQGYLLQESEPASAHENRMTIEFKTKADQQAFPVALASMFAKYLREAYMQLFNSYWQALDRNIPQTSGYWVDSIPFLEAAREQVSCLGIENEMLLRSR
jgi:hypothetical protein